FHNKRLVKTCIHAPFPTTLPPTAQFARDLMYKITDSISGSERMPRKEGISPSLPSTTFAPGLTIDSSRYASSAVAEVPSLNFRKEPYKPVMGGPILA